MLCKKNFEWQSLFNLNCNLVDVGVQEYEECEPVGHDEEGVPGQEPEKGLHNLHQYSFWDKGWI